MKKSLLVVLLALFATMFANAQIKREVFGLSLGQPMNEALTYLRGNGLTFVHLSTPLGEMYISNETVTFAGYTWTNMTVVEKNGELYRIAFEYTDDSPFAASDMLTKLMGNLVDKYRPYMQEVTKDEGSAAYILQIPFMDDNTSLNLSAELNRRERSRLTVSYTDLKLMSVELNVVNADEL